ncbi:MAG: sialidase family protein [Thermoplasmatota archaeon]
MEPEHLPRTHCDSACPVASADRQWLAFGPGDKVYVAYWQSRTSSAWLATSSDDGASFADFQHIAASFAGYPAVDANGTLFVPHDEAGVDPTGLIQSSSSAVLVAISRDGGKSFQDAEVRRGEDTEPGGFWPVACTDDHGDIFVAWTNHAGRVLVSRSVDDGRTWSSPIDWNRPSEDAALPPFLLTTGTNLTVIYYTQAGQVVSATGPTDFTNSRDRTFTQLLAGTTPSTTDFAYAALGQDTRLFVPITVASQGLVVVSSAGR